MTYVKVTVNGESKQILESKISLQGDRIVDNATIRFAPDEILQLGDKVKYFQDSYDLDDLRAAYLFQNTLTDESPYARHISTFASKVHNVDLDLGRMGNLFSVAHLR